MKLLTLFLTLVLASPVFGQTMGVGGTGVPRHTPVSRDYNQTTSTNLLNSDLSGNADGRLGTVSFWYRSDDAGQNTIALGAQGSAVEILNDTGGNWRVILLKVGGGKAFSPGVGSDSVGHNGDGVWHHFLASWNVDTDDVYLYIDGTDHLSGSPAGQGTDIDYTRSQHYESGIGAVSQRWGGCLADVWVSYAEAVDFSVEQNRLRFRNANGEPVYLGSDGSLPTGSQPIIFLQGTGGTNSGTGGNYTPTDIGTCTTTP